ncbi:MAG TPA: S8 family serine peptidase [Gemmatimonadales bacterium]
MIVGRRRAAGPSLAAAVLTAACAARGPTEVAPHLNPAEVRADRTAVAGAEPPQPLLPPQAAHLLGLLPRRTVGAEQFVAAHPTHDGRGILIAILDSGIDAGLPGLRTTTAGLPKLADLRDFAGEGRVRLTPVTPTRDVFLIAGRPLEGASRVRALTTGTVYGGVLVERALGALPAADVNGDGDRDDALPIVVARASDGWFLLADTDGDGSLVGETPVRDFAQAGDTFSFGPVTLAANFTDTGDAPRLDLFFDTSGHGTHVAGIAAGHNLFGVEGFDGIAPGAQLLGLKIANDARGGISVTGSMVRAMEYAAAFAERRQQPLVVNLSFGIGNDDGRGRPVIDSIIDAFALAHPGVVVVISAGNDGPGLSTVGFPGSAAFALSACALFPGAFAQAPTESGPAAEDVLGWWSARGGVFQKPDVCVPGVAFSNVPAWQTGEEVSGGTSMAAPQLAGVAALLLSALRAEGATADAAAIAAALRSTATPIPGATTLDAGAGVPNVEAAWRWLRAGHRAGRFTVRSAPDGTNRGFSAAYRRDGLNPADTLQRFTITSEGGQPFARLLLRPDAPWLRAPRAVDFAGAPATVPVVYDRRALQAPGLYVGTAWARPASDTLSGAAFGLTSAIVVPYTLERPLKLREYVAKGRSARFFFAVPEGAGGLTVRVAVADKEQAASLYLFEPTGQPQREEAALEIGGELPASGALHVRAEDLVPGVYEAVLVATPTRGATVAFSAALGPVGLGVRGADGIHVTNRSQASLAGSATVRALGGGKRFRMHGGPSVAARERLAVPEWARTLRIEVAFARAVWPQVTDVGVSVWDTSGYLVAEGPLNYAVGRQQVAVDPATLPVVDLEIMPGFARPDAETVWEAEVTVAFLPGSGTALAPTATLPLRLGAGASILLPWTADSLTWLPAGLEVLTEVRVTSDGNAPSVIRTLIPHPAATR